MNKLAAEFFATFALVFAGTGAIVINDVTGGTVVLDSRTAAGGGSPPSVGWSEALPPHSLENVGGAEIRVISVEIKSSRTRL